MPVVAIALREAACHCVGPARSARRREQSAAARQLAQQGSAGFRKERIFFFVFSESVVRCEAHGDGDASGVTPGPYGCPLGVPRFKSRL